MKTVLFYFDPISPYPFFASLKIPEFVKRNHVVIEAAPIVFGKLLDAHGNKGPAEIPAKRQNVWKDVLRLSLTHHVTIKGPPAHPYNPLSALRLCEAVTDRDQKLKLALALCKACWQDGEDLQELSALKKIADNIDLNGNDLINQIILPEIKERLKKNTEEAVVRGVFGVPTFWVDDELFWGHDRMDHLELYLQGKLNIDKGCFTALNNVPRAADRKSHVNLRGLLIQP